MNKLVDIQLKKLEDIVLKETDVKVKERAEEIKAEAQKAYQSVIDAEFEKAKVEVASKYALTREMLEACKEEEPALAQPEGVDPLLDLVEKKEDKVEEVKEDNSTFAQPIEETKMTNTVSYARRI